MGQCDEALVLGDELRHTVAVDAVGDVSAGITSAVDVTAAATGDSGVAMVSLDGDPVGLSSIEEGMFALLSTYAVGRMTQTSTAPRPALDRVELTPRERECLEWAAAGKSEWEISQILGISEHTSEKHLLNAKTKLGAVNRVQAVAEAIRRGYIS